MAFLARNARFLTRMPVRVSGFVRCASASSFQRDITAEERAFINRQERINLRKILKKMDALSYELKEPTDEGREKTKQTLIEQRKEEIRESKEERDKLVEAGFFKLSDYPAIPDEPAEPTDEEIADAHKDVIYAERLELFKQSDTIRKKVQETEEDYLSVEAQFRAHPKEYGGDLLKAITSKIETGDFVPEPPLTKEQDRILQDSDRRKATRAAGGDWIPPVAGPVWYYGAMPEQRFDTGPDSQEHWPDKDQQWEHIRGLVTQRFDFPTPNFFDHVFQTAVKHAHERKAKQGAAKK